MFCRSENRTIVKQSLSLLVTLAIWSNFVCLTSYGRGLTRRPLDRASSARSGVTVKPSHSAVANVPPSDVAATKETSAAQRIKLNNAYGKLPLAFEINKGQTDSQVRFLARGSGYNIFLTPTESVMVLRQSSSARGKRRDARFERSSSRSFGVSSVVRTRLIGARANPDISGLEELPGKSNYLIGNDPLQWRVGVSRFARVKYTDVYPGIDLVYYGNQGQLEHDYVVAPGADPGAIKLRFNGVRQLRIDRKGDLVLAVKGGELRQSKPIAYQMIEGQRREVASRYQLKSNNQVGVEVGTYDTSKPLVIDPVLLYSTYLGGSGTDSGSGIAVDSAGNAFITGSAGSTNFPTASPFDATLGGTSDVFVTKLAPNGSTLVYSTYIGGSGSDGGADIAIDAAGNAFITGTASSGFPTVTPAQSRIGGATDAFIAKLNPAGSALVYSTFLGGKLNDSGTGIAIDSAGSAYVTGTTSSTNFPVLGAIQGSNAGSDDAFVTKLNAAGNAFVYSTYLGGTNGERGNAIAVDSLGNAHITGTTFSSNFPTANAFQPNRAAGWEAFVTKLNTAGNGFVYSTYVGGSILGDFFDFGEDGRAITVDSAGNAYVTGSNDTVNFPTVNARQSFYGGGFSDGWLGKFSPTGSPIFISYLGGDGADNGDGIALDSSGNIFVTGVSATGQSGCSCFPTSNPIQSSNAGSNDGFVTKLTPDGLTLLYSTYIGGTDSDLARGIAVDAGGNAYIVGTTTSTNFPTANPFQAANAGPDDAFVLKITNQSGYAISGRVADDTGTGVAAVTISLSGSQSGVIQTDANGDFSFGNLSAGGNYTLTPSKASFTFVPPSRTFNVLSADQIADFTIQIFKITGRVTDSSTGAAIANTTMTLSGTQSATTQTDSLGNYTFANLSIGNYTVTPSKSEDILTYIFTPPSRSYTNLNSSQVADFVGGPFLQSTLFPLADAYVQDGTNAGVNFGTATTLKVQTGSQPNVGTNQDAYFKYDLSGVGQNISSVQLRITASLSAAGSLSSSVYSVADTSWIESGTGSITWNNRPARSATALSGASITVASTTLTTFDIDVTNYVKSEKAAGRDLVSLALHNPSASTIFINVNSREASANKPQLIVLAGANANSPPSVNLTSPANGATFAAPASIVLSATATDDASINRVDFYSGTSLIGSSTTPSGSTYSFTWNNVLAGSYNVYAVASDNSGLATTSNTSDITVGPANILPAVSIASPLNLTTFSAGTNISINATASDSNGSISKVEFFAGAALIGTATVPVNGLYTITWVNVNTGAYSLTAKATDNANGTTTSGAVNINVVAQTGLSPTADAYVRDGSTAPTNFGTATTLQTQSSTVGNNRESYLKFDLTTVTGIEKATVRLYGSLSDTTSSNIPASIYSGASTTWVESGNGSITWNNKPPSGATALATSVISNNVPRWYEFDVTAYLKAEKAAGRSVVSLVVKNTAPSTAFASFNSREATSNQPQLILWSTQARNALLVVGSATLNTGDSAARTRLQNLGYTVTVKVAGSNNNTSVKATDADGKTLVVISSTVNAANVVNKLRNIVVPVIDWEFDILDDMGMTGLVSGTDFGASSSTQTQLAIADPAHPLAAGLSGTQTVVTTATTFTWGKPNTNAARVAALTTDATRFAIFGYDAGATMPGLDAPSRRIALFLTDTTAASLNSNGGALFDAAVRWATEVITAPSIKTLTPASGPIGTVVTISGLNFGAAQGTSTLTFNAAAAAPTSWSDQNIVVAVPAFASTGAVIVTVNGIPSNAVIFTVGDVDSDGDGLPDWWELQYFGNLSQGANDDPDGDGRTNLQEYQQGRNPTKSALSDDGDFVNLKVHTPLSP
jgi:Big-like domain-containing protein/IPT/TIG domain-containing protein/carboxypeptidase family protein/beta-propeller repeat-containing protein